MAEYNLLKDYPRSKRQGLNRVITDDIKKIVEKLDFNYWDGKRDFGFGGYIYDGRWQIIAKAAKERYNLDSNSKVLVERCGAEKGFLVYDLKKLIPGITVYGMHCATYPLNHAMEGYGKWALINGIEKNEDPKTIEEKARLEVLPYLLQCDPRNIIFKDNYFDTVISINSACAYEEKECRQVIREIKRVSKENGRYSYIQNDSWKTEEEEEMLKNWTLLCKTFLNTENWTKLYKEEGYNGDWGFTIIE